MKLIKISIFLIVSFITSNNSFAAYSNYNLIIPGDKSAGMGGAATALVGDVSSASYFNPATLAELEGQAYSAAVGIYKKYDTVYGKEEDFTKAPLRANLGFFKSLPASSGSMIKYEDLSLCLSIVVPDYDNYKGDLKNTANNVSTLSYLDESLWVGGSVAKIWDNKNSVGVTFYYTARNALTSVQDRSYLGADTKVFTSEKLITQNALVTILGFYHKYSSDLQFGLSARLPAGPIHGTGSLYESYIDSADSTNNKNLNLSELESIVRIPGKLTAGFSYNYNPELQITGDLSIYEGVRYFDFISDQGNKVEYVHKSILNASLGAEWAWREWFKFRIGGFTNFSAHPNVKADLTEEQPDKVDQLGFSANFIYIKDKKIGYTFGGYYSGGRGKSMQRIDQQYSVVTKTQQVFTMLVGTNFFF